MCVLSIKVPIRKKSGKLFNDPRTRNYNFLSIFILRVAQSAGAGESYLPTPPLGQDMTQGQFLSGGN